MSDKDNKKWLQAAYLLALDSPDPSTQNGSVIVRDGEIIGSGRNEFPEGVKYSNKRLQRPLKYAFIEHAERNSIFEGGDVEGGVMYCLWAACDECARAIIQSGISKLVTHSFYSPDETSEDRKDWKTSISNAFKMLKEAGVEVEFTDVELDMNEPLRFNGELVTY